MPPFLFIRAIKKENSTLPDKDVCSGCAHMFPKPNMKAKAINIRSIQIRFCLHGQRETTKLPSCKSNGNDCRMKLAYNEQRFLLFFFIGARGRVRMRAFSSRFSLHFASPLRRVTDDDSEREKTPTRTCRVGLRTDRAGLHEPCQPIRRCEQLSRD